MRKEIVLLLLANNFWLFGEGMLGPLFALFSQRVHGNVLQIAWVWSTYLILTGALVIAVGRFSEVVGKERLLVAGFLLNALFTYLYLLVRSQASLLLVQIGLAVATALATPTWDALYTKFQREGESSFLWGMHVGQGQIVTGLAVITGGLVVSSMSFDALFLIMGTVQLFSTVFLLPIVRQR